MKKIMLFITLMALMTVHVAFAQNRTVTGVVTADDGETLPGVSVVVEGTSIGTITGNDGAYTIDVPSGIDKLIFKFIGLETMTIDIVGSVVNATMQQSSVDVDEVIVVGYGTTTKESFTGTATKVSAEKLQAKSVSNISQALQGEVAGVQVIGTSGQPGSSAKIRIRGIGSINGSREPLYIVDGAPLQGDINSISPSDIESTSVLKDASATAIYGSRGANGVVIITTKKGKTGKSNIELDFKYGTNFRFMPEYDVMTTPEEYVEASWTALKTRGLLSGEADPAAYASANLWDQSGLGLDESYNLWDVAGAELIDQSTGKVASNVNRRYDIESWEDELFQTAKRTEVGVRLSGGTEKNRYFNSFNYLNDEGYYLNSDFKRLTGRSNIDHQVKPWLKGSMNMGYMYSVSNYAGGSDSDSNNGFWLVVNSPTIYPVYARDADGEKIADEMLGGYVFDFGDGQTGIRRFASLTNAAATSTYDVVRSTRNQASGAASLTATIIDGLTFKTNFGLEYLHSAYDNLGNAFYGGSAEQGGSIFKSQTDYFAYTLTNMFRYEKEIDDHSFNVMLAQEASFYQKKYMSAFKSGLADPFSLELDNAVVSSPSGSYLEEQTLESYFGQVSYDFDKKYFVSGVVRRDGSSKFVNEKWGTFGSGGVAWVVSKEDFFSSMTSVVDNFKLKASYGVIGEQGGIGAFSGMDLYEVNNLNDNISLTEASVGNPDLTWEQSKQFQVGAEFDLFNRVGGSIDYYSKKTDDLLFERRVGPSNGYVIMNVNDGAMVNSGVEVVLDVVVVETSDLNINFNINAAFENNEITKMPIDPSTGEEKPLDLNGLYGRSVGHSMFDIYTKEYAGVDSETGAAQWYSYYNEIDGEKTYILDMVNYTHDNKGNIGTIGKEKTSVYADATQKYIDKTPIPVVRGSFSLSADYKGFALTALFGYSLGGHGYDGNYANLMDDGLIGGNNWHKDFANAWKNPGDVTDVPAFTAGYSNADVNYSNSNSSSDRFVTSTNYLTLNNVNLSYSFNKSLLKKAKIQGVKLFASADNLWALTARQGYYPNTSEVGASGTYQYGQLTNISAGINIKF